MRHIETEYNNKDVLHAFEKLRDIEPSPEWTESLIYKINTSTHQKRSRNRLSSVIVIVFALLLINSGFFLIELLSDTNNDTTHTVSLHSISDNLLINPISIKN